MAQTIAAQRGTTTVTTNGQTSATLFTQSTGTATRVILNSVSFKVPNGGTGPKMSLCVDLNNTGNETCVAFIAGCNTGSAIQGLTMFPNSSIAPIQTTTTSAATYADRWVLGMQDNANFGTKITNVYSGLGPNGSAQSANNISVDLVPSQFWMNSGDVLKIRVFHAGSSETATITYSFTTITES